MLFTFIYYISFIYSKVWFQNRRAKMRRQLKLQGQCPGPYVKRDNDETSPKASKSLKHAERSDGEHWEKQQEAEGYPWTTQKLGKWERPEGPSSEELRSCSIAKLRAKAREHEAEIQGNVSMSGGTKQSQTQETDATHNDWSFSIFLFIHELELLGEVELKYLAVISWIYVCLYILQDFILKNKIYIMSKFKVLALLCIPTDF